MNRFLGDRNENIAKDGPIIAGIIARIENITRDLHQFADGRQDRFFGIQFQTEGNLARNHIGQVNIFISKVAYKSAKKASIRIIPHISYGLH